ncbi:hypothetical protein V7166_17250, partial [Bacillus thuringiensis]
PATCQVLNKDREQVEVLFWIVATYMSKNQNGVIYLSKDSPEKFFENCYNNPQAILFLIRR